MKEQVNASDAIQQRTGKDSTPNALWYQYIPLPHLFFLPCIIYNIITLALALALSLALPRGPLSVRPLDRPRLSFPSDNKFSSFVRQLNFYGFRKVKSNITVEGHDSKWWEFKVRHFAFVLILCLTCFTRSSPTTTTVLHGG